jgi:DNA polymerase
MTAPLNPEDIRALKSLISWWEQSGVEALPPLPAPKTAQPAPPPSVEARATGAQARQAGFGAAPTQNGRAIAQAAQTLDELKQALDAYDGCPLKATATQTVFARGNPQADVMVIGEAPGREEDREGVPYIGPAGQLLDRMLKAIGLDETSAYITNVVFWRPPGNRKPTDAEIETCLPFAERHIELVRPKFIVLAGGIAAQSLLHSKTGIMALRGRWHDYKLGDGTVIPALPMYHPAFLLRRPQEKAKSWQDLLSLKAKLAALQV